MDKITWSKEIALEIIRAGFLRVAKRLHPDVGGTHEQILTLTATKEFLENFVAAGRSEPNRPWRDDWTRAREEPHRPRDTYRSTRSKYWNQSQDFTGEVPLEPYPDDADYVQLVDVVIMSITEKAYKIKIPSVKQAQWLPKSQLWEEYDFTEGATVTIVFTKWIARQKNWMK